MSPTREFAEETARNWFANWTEGGRLEDAGPVGAEGYIDLAATAVDAALRQIRELHVEDAGWCFGCDGSWPCLTAQLCYSPEELNAGGPA